MNNTADATGIFPHGAQHFSFFIFNFLLNKEIPQTSSRLSTG